MSKTKGKLKVQTLDQDGKINFRDINLKPFKKSPKQLGEISEKPDISSSQNEGEQSKELAVSSKQNEEEQSKELTNSDQNGDEQPQQLEDNDQNGDEQPQQLEDNDQNGDEQLQQLEDNDQNEDDISKQLNIIEKKLRDIDVELIEFNNSLDDYNLNEETVNEIKRSKIFSEKIIENIINIINELDIDIVTEVKKLLSNQNRETQDRSTNENRETQDRSTNENQSSNYSDSSKSKTDNNKTIGDQMNSLAQQIQEIFKLIYKLIVYICLCILFVILLIILCTFPYVAYVNIYSEHAKYQANDSIFPIYKTWMYTYLSYVYTKPSDFNIIDNDQLLYLPIYLLLSVSGLLFTVAVIMLINSIILSVLIYIQSGKNGVSMAFKDSNLLMDDRTFSLFTTIAGISLILWMSYLLLFNTFVFRYVKESYQKSSECDIILEKSILGKSEGFTNEELDQLYRDALEGDPFTVIKTYIKKNKSMIENSPKIAEKCAVTYVVLRYIKETHEDVDGSPNTLVHDRIVSLLTDPVGCDDTFSGMICDSIPLTTYMNKQSIQKLFVIDNKQLSIDNKAIDNAITKIEEINTNCFSANESLKSIQDTIYSFLIAIVSFILLILITKALMSETNDNVFKDFFNTLSYYATPFFTSIGNRLSRFF